MLIHLEINNPEWGKPNKMLWIDYDDDAIFSHMHTLGKIFKEEIITTIDKKVYTYHKKRANDDISSLLTIDTPDAYKDITFDLFRRELFLEKTQSILWKIEDALHKTPLDETLLAWDEANWLFVLSGDDKNSVSKLLGSIEEASNNLACCQSNLAQHHELSLPEIDSLNFNFQYASTSLDEVLIAFFSVHYRLLCKICPSLTSEERNFIASMGFINNP